MGVSGFKPRSFPLTLIIMEGTVWLVGQTGTLVSKRIINMFNTTAVTYRYRHPAVAMEWR